MGDAQAAVTSFYFAMTSLSTVGFGDYFAVSDMERLSCALIFIFGTAIFSYIQSLFLDLVQ